MPIETRDEFVERNGGRKALLRTTGGESLLPTGARILEHIHGSQLIGPPMDLEDRLQAKRRYWQLKLDRTTADFNALKAAVSGKGAPYKWKEDEHGPLPDSDPTTALGILRDLARQYRAAVADIDAKYNALPSVIQRRKAEAEEAERQRQFDAEMRQRDLAQREAVAAITLDD